MTTESYPEVCIPPTHSSASTATGARSLSFERVLNTTEGINKPVRLHLYLAAEDGCAWTDFEGVLASLVKVMSDLQVYEGQAVRSCREEAAYPAATLAAAEKASAPAEAQTASGSSFTFRNGLHWGMSPEEVLAAEGVSQFAYTKPISDRMMIQDLLVNLSKFVSDGAYIFVDNRLVMTAFSIESSSADDAAYLAAALEQVYGPGTRGGALDSKLVRIVEFLGGTVDGVDGVDGVPERDSRISHRTSMTKGMIWPFTSTWSLLSPYTKKPGSATSVTVFPWAEGSAL